jgi:hypothetical protein
VARRATAVLVVEVALGAGVLVAGIAATTASRAGPSAAITTTTATNAATTTTTGPATTITTTTAPATTATHPGATTPPPTTTVTSTTAAPSSVRPITTHRAAIDVLAARPVTTPVRVTIPALDVDGPVLPAGVNSESELDVPPDAGTLVWYRHGPSPGERGSAVVAGHLNWRGVSGLFADLAATPIGAEITVGYDDGSKQSFVVSSVELVPKPAVSVNGVFARGGARVLRLVTCGGEFDDAVRSYRSNVVVTAVPA